MVQSHSAMITRRNDFTVEFDTIYGKYPKIATNEATGNTIPRIIGKLDTHVSALSLTEQWNLLLYIL